MVGGELFSHVQGQGGGMEEGTARLLFRQIVSGLDYMHVRHISHTQEDRICFRLGEQEQKGRKGGLHCASRKCKGGRGRERREKGEGG